MSSNSWDRPWSTQEIVDSASNWSLAGDAGLLKYLETFSENLLSKAEDTNTNLNKLLDDLSSASLSLDVIKNEFSSLHNVQFVESRVYEEDETLVVDESQENVKDTKISEDERTGDMKVAVLRGIEVIDKYYEKVEVPASDSEDETDFPNFVLRPKDPYLDRPLPYIIGSQDWHNKWHVGLLDSSSESETDRVSEKFSDSDSESDLPVQNRSQVNFKGISNSGSEADLTNRKNINPVANSTFDDSIKQQGIFGSSDSEDYNSVPVQAPISNRSFAQELAAKLGNVIEQNTQVIEPEINKRPIQSAAPVPGRIIGNIFSDEPPPIDEDDVMFGKSNIKQGMFSGGGDLFDDLDNSSGLWNEKREPDKKSLEVSAPKSKLPDLFDDEDDNIFSAGNSHAKSAVVSENITSKKLPEGLFDDDSSEDDLFNEGTNRHSVTKPFLQPASKPTMPFIDNEPPELESKPVISREENIKPKKPIGGVKIFAGTDLFNNQKVGGLLKIRRQESSESSDKDENITNKAIIDESPSKISDKSKDLFSNVNKQTAINTAKKDDTKENTIKESSEASADTEKNLKQLSLFDDDDIGDDFGDDLFSNISTKKFTSSLFEEKPLGNDLFANVPESNKPSSSDLFTEAAVKEPSSNELFTEANISKSGNSTSNDLFEDVNINKANKPPSNDLFGETQVIESSKPIKVEQRIKQDENNSLFSDNVVVTEEPTADSKKASTQTQKDAGSFKAANLFNPDSDDEIDDLFSINKPTKSPQMTVKPIAAPRNIKSETISGTHDGQKQDSMSKNKPGSVSINFFDQNPPDDDDDWDTKSDNNLFEENDPTLFDNTPEISSHRSGLFDNEPPSLFYESSGIVRDFSARVETDESFNPYASSSRRFSTDIFNEQQSNDSFFITKNKSSHLEPQPTLGSIQEVLKPNNKEYSYSNVDITPSGNIDDLLPDSAISVTGASLQTQNNFAKDLQTDKIKNNNDDDLFDEPSLEESSGSDLFAPPREKKITKAGTVKDGEKISSNTIEKTKVKPPITTKPSVSSKKDELNENTSANIQGSVTPKIGSPGKLKHNLNINVGALLPGVSPPKKKDFEKSNSFDVTSSVETSATEISSKSLSPTSSRSTEELPEDVPPNKIDKPDFEGSSNLPGILPSITKDRVRIPIKRRPSTRKARQESIRNSGIDFKINLESEQGTKSDEDIKTVESLEASPPKENIFEKPKEIPKNDLIPKRNEQLSKPEPPFFSDSSESESLFTENVNEKSKNIPKSNEPLESDPLFAESVDQNPKEISKKSVKKTYEELDKPDVSLFDDIPSDPLFTINVDQKPKEFSKKDVKKSNEQLDKPDMPLFDELPSDPLFTNVDQKPIEISKKNVRKSNDQLDKPLFDDLPSDPLFKDIVDQKPKEMTKKRVQKSKEELDKPDIPFFDEPLESDPLFAENIVETKKVAKEEKIIEEQRNPSIFGGEKRSVINSDSFESADFKKSDLFDDSEEFDDIFSSKKLPPKSNILKKSLFDDELDDDDIFGSSSSNDRNVLLKNASGSSAPQKKSAKITQIKKLENKATVEDPLSSFND